MKRALDIFAALAILILTLPILLVVVIGLKLSSPGPVFYKADRVGKGGERFKMLKFRSMHVSNSGSVITSKNDSRIFPFGKLLRKLKLDEMPQFLNVLKGDMSLVGPRPEDPKIVDTAYTDWMMETLRIAPGITSPGAVFYYIKGEQLVSDEDPEGSYIRDLLPPKLAIERAYVERANFFSDIQIMFYTAWAIIGQALGFGVTPPHRDMAAAEAWVEKSTFEHMA